ncbi:hypothetical protein [Pseudomonas syringae]|uniref:hypothetical protein n=1 Tax=Pseudomonas syringae TaxID=317 RepID=UPI000A46F036|nr:hypothetical protein [Pseudomonas syringae]
MFQTHLKASLGGGVSSETLYDHVLHSLDAELYCAKACYLGARLTDLPEHRMMMTSSLALLDRVLSGKEEGVSIDTIQVLSPTDAGSAHEGTYDLGRVARITRLKPRRGLPRYLVETAAGNILSGDVDGHWGSCKRTVLFDSNPSQPRRAALAEGGERVIADIRTDVIIRVLDLYTVHKDMTERWWQQRHPELDNKAPSELKTLAEYQKLIELLQRLARDWLGTSELKND